MFSLIFLVIKNESKELEFLKRIPFNKNQINSICKSKSKTIFKLKNNIL